MKKKTEKPLSINSLSDKLKRDRRTVGRAVLHAGLVPVSHEAGHPRYALAEAEEAVEDYLVSNLPPWNPSPEETSQRLADLAIRLAGMIQDSGLEVR